MANPRDAAGRNRRSVIGFTLVGFYHTGTGDDGGLEETLAALTAILLGGLLFIPWLPSLIFQAQHTGTPWAARLYTW